MAVNGMKYAEFTIDIHRKDLHNAATFDNKVYYTTMY